MFKEENIKEGDKQGDIVEWEDNEKNKRSLVVPYGKLWVEGDNKPFSNDSRFHGPIPSSSVFGKLSFRV